MDSSGESKLSFFLNTKGLCFLCLRETQTDSDSCSMEGDIVESDNLSCGDTSKVCSFQALSRYLEIRFRKVFDTSVPLQLNNDLLEKSELLVSLCESCSMAVDQFTDFYKEFEVIQMRLLSCIKTIRDKAVQGEASIPLMDEYKKRMGTDNHQEIVQTEIIENLRQETVRKCLLRIQKELPTVKLDKMEGTKYCSKNNVISGSIDTNQELLPVDRDSSLNAQVNPRLKSIENMDCTSDDMNDSISSPLSAGEQSVDEQDSKVAEEKESTSKIRSVVGPGGRQLYQCNFCGKYYDKLCLLVIHKKSAHMRISQLKCKYCKYTFKDTNFLRNHTITYHYEESFMGLKDPDLPKDLFQAAVDILLHGGQKIYQLPENDHRRNKKRYLCSYCSQTYVFRRKLRFHLIQAHYNTLRTKLLELQKSPDLVVLRKHAEQIANGTQKELTEEELESMTEKKIGGLQDAGVCPYLLGKRRKFRTGPKPPVEKPTTTCPKCGLTLPTRGAWIQHTRLECTENEYGKTAREETHGSKVMYSNSIWKIRKNPLTCGKCKKRFRDFDTMKKHLEIQHPPVESGESYSNGFPCDHCIKKFRFFFSYRIHLLSVHRQQVFASYAPPGTKQKEVSDAIKATLKKLAKLSSGTHVCDVCKKEFKSVSEMENHVVVVHFDETVEQFKIILGIPEEGPEPEEEPPESNPKSSDSTNPANEANVSCNDAVANEEVDEMVMYPEVKIEEADDSDKKPEISDPLFILP